MKEEIEKELEKIILDRITPLVEVMIKEGKLKMDITKEEMVENLLANIGIKIFLRKLDN